VQLWLEGTALGNNAVSSLESFHIDEGGIELLKAVVQYVLVAVVSRRTDHVTCHAVLPAFAEADMADGFKGASGSNQRFYGLDIACASRLDDERRLAVNVVHIRIHRDSTHSVRRAVKIDSSLDQIFDIVKLLGEDGHLK